MLQSEFENVLMPFRARLFRFAQSMMGSRDGAEDVVQEVYLKLWKQRDRLTEVQNVEAYAYRAVKHTVLNWIRKKGREWEDFDAVYLESDIISGDELAFLSDAQAIVARLIEGLPARQRAIFKLREVELFEVERIAEIMETDINNVRVNLSIARKRLKRTYENIMTNEKRRTEEASGKVL